MPATMTVPEIMKELEEMGSEQTRRTFANHGAPPGGFGVKIGDMKKIVKKVKANHELAMGLYATGNSDAMYLAGLIAEPMKMSKKDLQDWAKKATWYMIGEYTVAWVAAESRFGWELGLEWIESKKEPIACAGWATLSSMAGIEDDSELDIAALEKLIERVEKEIHGAPNRVRYTMNGFVIAVGCGVKALSKRAVAAGKKIGKVSVDMGGTSCKVPDINAYIKKVADMGRTGHKKKQARC